MDVTTGAAVAERDINDVIAEAESILSGALQMQPTLEHLKALQLSMQFWRCIAREDRGARLKPLSNKRAWKEGSVQ